MFNVITGYGETAGAALAAHPDVDKIAFTGSTEVGRLIVKAAAGNLKRLTLELGGKSPLIMFDDANLDKAIMNASLGLLAGSGQNCSCTSRIYVQRGIYDQVVEGIAGFAKMLPMGGSEDPDSVLGPLISEKQRQRVEGIVAEGVSRGAEIITGGKRMDRRGFFYEATIVTNTTARHAAHPRGDLRPGRLRDPLRRRGRGARRRERHGIRTGRSHLDRERRPGASRRE